VPTEYRRARMARTVKEAEATKEIRVGFSPKLRRVAAMAPRVKENWS